jgi:hypothetical protein
MSSSLIHARHRLLPLVRGSRHCERLPTTTVVHYFEKRTNLYTMTGGTSASGASDVFGMGPSSGYIRKLTLVFIFIYVLSGMPCFHTLGHVIVVHMLHDLAGMLFMTNIPCLHILNHGFMVHIRTYDVIITMLIFIYVINFMVLFF